MTLEERVAKLEKRLDAMEERMNTESQILEDQEYYDDLARERTEKKWKNQLYEMQREIDRLRP